MGQGRNGKKKKKKVGMEDNNGKVRVNNRKV